MGHASLQYIPTLVDSRYHKNWRDLRVHLTSCCRIWRAGRANARPLFPWGSQIRLPTVSAVGFRDNRNRRHYYMYCCEPRLLEQRPKYLSYPISSVLSTTTSPVGRWPRGIVLHVVMREASSGLRKGREKIAHTLQESSTRCRD